MVIGDECGVNGPSLKHPTYGDGGWRHSSDHLYEDI